MIYFGFINILNLSDTFSVKSCQGWKKDSISTLPGADKFIEAAQTRVMLAMILAFKGYYPFSPGSMGQPPLIHSRQSMGNCWMQGRMNACYVTKHGTSMIETKTNGMSPALKEFNQMEKTKKIIVSQCAAISYWWPCYALWQHRMISYGKWHRGTMHFCKGRMSENVGRIKEVFIKRIAFELGHKQNLKFCHVL